MTPPGARLAAVLLLAIACATDATTAAADAAAADAARCSVADGELLPSPRVEDFRTVMAGARSFLPAGIAPPSLLEPQAPGLDGQAAAAIAAFLARGETRLRIVSQDRDRYGRLPALLGSGERLLAVELLERGLAVALPTRLGDWQESCAALFLAAEERGRRAGRGLWAGPNLIGNAHRPDALSSQYGRYVIVSGTIVSVGNRPARTYLDFGRVWSRDFTAQIAANRRDAFGGAASLEKLTGQRVRLRGFLAEKSGPMLELEAPWQLEIVPRD